MYLDKFELKLPLEETSEPCHVVNRDSVRNDSSLENFIKMVNQSKDPAIDLHREVSTESIDTLDG